MRRLSEGEKKVHAFAIVYLVFKLSQRQADLPKHTPCVEVYA
jgi:hypothetical protein